ncbi:Flagellar biosynthesis protein FlhF [Rhodospirillaceae bacterium LM-1]|nr:Flagellar biosynthesis protein FlhF [Rhodospirillaceae bacterium LM-1]
MRLKTFTAPGMAEAMQTVRRELGDEAIIVSTQKDPDTGEVHITAALESSEAEEDAIERMLGGGMRPFISEAVRQALSFHGVPGRLIERLVVAAAAVDSDDPVMACAAALDANFIFAPLPDKSAPRPFILLGPPGGGKTITVAKLAARSVMKGRRVGVITTDSVRAGVVEQLASFTRIMDIELKVARGPEALKRLLEDNAGLYDLTFIDSPGLNPFQDRDQSYLADLVEASKAEPIMVMAAGGDSSEASEMGEIYANLGVTRLLATRLDATRRLGAVLAAAASAEAMFCEVAVSPHVASGLVALNPVSLARLLVADPDEQVANALHEHPSYSEALT